MFTCNQKVTHAVHGAGKVTAIRHGARGDWFEITLTTGRVLMARAASLTAV